MWLFPMTRTEQHELSRQLSGFASGHPYNIGFLCTWRDTNPQRNQSKLYSRRLSVRVPQPRVGRHDSGEGSVQQRGSLQTDLCDFPRRSVGLQSTFRGLQLPKHPCSEALASDPQRVENWSAAVDTFSESAKAAHHSKTAARSRAPMVRAIRCPRRAHRRATLADPVRKAAFTPQAVR